MFNVIDIEGGWKADFIIRKERPFSVEEFRRRQPASLGDCVVSMASAEDVILSKLEWDKLTPSQRQLQDALNVAIAEAARLDVKYLRHWAVEIGVTDSLDALLGKVVEARQRSP